MPLADAVIHHSTSIHEKKAQFFHSSSDSPYAGIASGNSKCRRSTSSLPTMHLPEACLPVELVSDDFVLTDVLPTNSHATTDSTVAYETLRHASTQHLGRLFFTINHYRNSKYP